MNGTSGAPILPPEIRRGYGSPETRATRNRKSLSSRLALADTNDVQSSVGENPKLRVTSRSSAAGSKIRRDNDCETEVLISDD